MADRIKNGFLETLKTKPIYIFEPYLTIAHKVCFSCSPIDRNRYEAQHKQMVDRRNGESPDPSKRSQSHPQIHPAWASRWFWILSHPIEMTALVKRYHMAGNGFIFWIAVHLGILFHLTLKALVNLLYTGTDRDKLEYLNRIYYPPLLGVSSNPALFNHVNLAICLYCLIARLRSFFRLLRDSVRNAEIYEKLTVTQVNVSFLSTIYLNYYQVKKFWIDCIKHRIEIKCDRLARDAHVEFSPEPHIKIEELSRDEMLSYYNLVDFNQCSGPKVDYLKIEGRSKRYRRWFCPKPLWRCDVLFFRLGTFLNLLAIALLSGGFVFACFAVTYMELRSRFSESEEPSLLETFSIWMDHFSKPLHILRSVEFFILIAAQVPHHFDSILIFGDAIILCSRIEKFATLMEIHLEQSKRWNYSSSEESFATVHHYPSLSRQTELPWLCPGPKCDLDRASGHLRFSEKSDFNKKLQHDINLVRVVYIEFLNIRQTHSGYLNQIVIGHGIILVYLSFLLLKLPSDREYYLLIIAGVSSIAGPTAVLVFCALVEKTVSILAT